MWRQIWGRPAWPRSASGMSPPAIKGGIWFIPRGLEKSGTWGPLLLLINIGGWSFGNYVQCTRPCGSSESRIIRIMGINLTKVADLEFSACQTIWVPERIDGCWLREGWHVAPMNSTRAEDRPSASQSPPIDALMQGGLRQFAGNCRSLHCRRGFFCNVINVSSRFCDGQVTIISHLPLFGADVGCKFLRRTQVTSN
jgi:hypothetical protein